MTRHEVLPSRRQPGGEGKGVSLGFVAGQKEEGLVELPLFSANGKSSFANPLDGAVSAELGRDFGTRGRAPAGGDQLEISAEKLLLVGGELGFGLQVAKPL